MKTAIRMATWLQQCTAAGTPFDLEGFLRDAKAAGYDGVELTKGAEVLGDAATVQAAAKRHGLQMSAFATGVTYNPWLPNTKAYRADMRYAQAIGTEKVAVTGGFNYYGRRTQYAADYDLFAGNLKRASAYADKLGLELFYYPHVGAIVETAAETAMLVERLPKLRIGVDVAQIAAAGGDAVAFLRTFRERLAYVFVADFDLPGNRFMELGRGDSPLDVAACVRVLREIGYGGWVTVALGQTTIGAVKSARVNRKFLRRQGL